MSRWVQPGGAGLKAVGHTAPDGPLDRIVKYVPAEVVSVYIMLFSLLASISMTDAQKPLVAMSLMALFLACTFFYVWTRSPPGPSRKAHLLVSPLAFLAWAYPLSSALLGSYFVGLVAFAGQALVVAISIFVAPRE